MDHTIKQAAARLRVSAEKVRLLIQEGQLPHAYKLDPSKETSPYRIPEQDLKTFETKRRFPKPPS